MARQIISGVYCITNTVNGHRYIGSSIDVYTRWVGHKLLLRKGNHTNQILQRAWDKYGEDAFEFTVLVVCTKDDTLLHEQEYLDRDRPEYNIAINARAPMLGIPMPEEVKQKIGDGQRGMVWTEERKQKQCIAQKGHHSWSAENYAKHEGKMPDNTGSLRTEQSKRKMSEAHKGKPWSDARRQACNKARSHDGTPS